MTWPPRVYMKLMCRFDRFDCASDDRNRRFYRPRPVCREEQHVSKVCATMQQLLVAP